ncbi:MAG: 7-cyano-7-deazaguanine synthase, partial [Clostridia bacterium]|nr:7-cyano-7-deazaguanine synthase [Clostridia bacterium]
MKKVLVAMSGGVDSAVAALRLIEAGYDVQGITLCLLDGKTDEAQRAAAVCERIGIKHTSLHLEKEFEREVQQSFVQAYCGGLTPNPCVVCNKKIKFGALMDYALQNGFDMLATGHYAAIEKMDDRYVIKKAADKTKDQTYMLWQLSQDVLSRVLFPLSDYKKSENREKAAQYSLENADSPDSQDICFID